MIYKLKPILKHRLWGGTYFDNVYNIKSKGMIGESWILSCINDDNSPIDDHTTLKDIFLKNKNIVAQGYKGDFPILIKLISAYDDLSIQVHPSIKTEFWYVLNTDPTKLYLGFNKDTNRLEVEKALNSSTLPSMLNNIDVSFGDCYLINPGTIHAIGKGTFLIEIQQSADVTYRLYDYNRKDSDGKTRPLHIKESLDCINYKKLNIEKGKRDGHVISTPYFNVYRYKLNSIKEFNAKKSSFHFISVLFGSGLLKTEHETIMLNTYDAIFIPAGEGKYTIEGDILIVMATL